MCLRLKCHFSTIPYFHVYLPQVVSVLHLPHIQQILKSMACFPFRLQLPWSRLVSHFECWWWSFPECCSSGDHLSQSLGHCFSSTPSPCVCPRRGCPHLPSPQTQSSAGCSIQLSPGRSPALCLVNVKIRRLLPPTWLVSNGGI